MEHFTFIMEDKKCRHEAQITRKPANILKQTSFFWQGMVYLMTLNIYSMFEVITMQYYHH